ncbi:hypothetical protein [Streptomyces winkii]|uniref:hypothetical protein n=1 Tax=Streptomyces winkii TaxID=3051178 RepID=UPI0028D8B9A3|nr:hypothetical protein [Streptomyces sp. DSM 40971]
MRTFARMGVAGVAVAAMLGGAAGVAQADSATPTETVSSRGAEKAAPIWLQEGTYDTVQACSDRGSLGDVLGWWLAHECRVLPWGVELWVFK